MTVRETIANLLKLHETQIVNIGPHDEEEAKRRRKVRYETTGKILSLKDKGGKPMLAILHPDQGFPIIEWEQVKDLAIQVDRETWQKFLALLTLELDFIKEQGWRRVILQEGGKP